MKTAVGTRSGSWTLDLAGEIGLEQRHGREDAQPCAQRHDDARGARPRPLQVARCQPERHGASLADASDQTKDAAREQRQQKRAHHGHADEDGADLGAGDIEDGKKGQETEEAAHQSEVARARPGARRCHQRPEQAGRARFPSHRQGPEREEQRCREPGAAGQEQRQRIEAVVDRHGQDARRQEPHQKRQELANDEPDGDADAGQGQDLQQIGGEDLPAGGAEALERGDRRALGGEIALDGEPDPEPADQERRQPGQRQIGGEPVGEAGDLRLHVGTASRPP